MGSGFPLREWVSRSQDFESFCIEKLLDSHDRHSGDSSRFAAARDPCSVALVAKVRWRGTLIGVQPRIRLMRSFDARSHTYLGYVLRVEGAIGAEEREFLVAVVPRAHGRLGFRAGDRLSGVGEWVANPLEEIAELYKVSGLKVEARGEEAKQGGPPFHALAPPLPVYRERGHRRLKEESYEEKCRTCVWGCRMPVEMIVDHWNPSKVKHRTETFCYGPLSCPSYDAGSRRRVPGRKGATWTEDDWVDEDATSHRGRDE